MGTLLGFFMLMALWVVGCLAIIILPFVIIVLANRQPEAPLLPALPDPPDPPAKPEPRRPTPTRQQIEAIGPVVYPKWDGTYRWRVGEEKRAWDREFATLQLARRAGGPRRE